MKKIYFSLAVLSVITSGSFAQADRLSADVREGLSMPVTQVDLSSIQVAKGPANVFSTMGCDSISTTFAGGNSQSGNMFDLVNTSSVAIQITNVDQNFNGTSSDTISIYYINGTFVGNEANPSAWTFAGKAMVAPSSPGSPEAVPISLAINIPSGQTVGMYITMQATGSYLNYTNGLTMGAAYKTENGLQFNEGKGVAYPFGATYPTSGTASRIWNGNIYYCTPLILGINESSSGNVSVYPNPANSFFTVKNNSGSQMNKAILSLTDMMGRLIYSQNNINENEIRVNTENFKSGLYILQVQNGNSLIVNQKISIQ